MIVKNKNITSSIIREMGIEISPGVEIELNNFITNYVQDNLVVLISLLAENKIILTDSNFVELTTDNAVLAIIKMIKQKELSDKFDEQFLNGSFQSSLGFRADNRRSGNKNDKDNVQGLIDLGITTFKDATGNFHTLTLAQLGTLKNEMIADGLGKYQKKWTFEAQIATSTDKTALESLAFIF